MARHSVVADLAAHRVLGKGPDGYPRHWSSSQGSRRRRREQAARGTERTARRAAPVTNLTNIFYLTGFDSSNAALLVEPGGGATLFTDFRYAEAARAVPDVDVQMTKRSMMADIGSRLKGRVQFEADVLRTSSGAAQLGGRRPGADARARRRRCAPSRMRKRSQSFGRRRESPIADSRRSRRDVVGRSEKEIAWRLRELLHAHAPTSCLRDDRRLGPNGALPHAHPTDRIVDRGTLVTVDWACASTATQRLHTHGLHRRLPGKLRTAYSVCLAARNAPARASRRA